MGRGGEVGWEEQQLNFLCAEWGMCSMPVWWVRQNNGFGDACVKRYFADVIKSRMLRRGSYPG